MERQVADYNVERLLPLALLAHPVRQTYSRRRTGMQQSTADVGSSTHLQIFQLSLLHFMPIMVPTSAVLPVFLSLIQMLCCKRRFQCRPNRQLKGHQLRRHYPCQASSKTHCQVFPTSHRQEAAFARRSLLHLVPVQPFLLHLIQVL